MRKPVGGRAHWPPNIVVNHHPFPGRVAAVVEHGAAAIAISSAMLQADNPADLLHQLWIELTESRKVFFQHNHCDCNS